MEMQMALAMAMAEATLPNSMPERRLPAPSPPPPPPPAVALGSRFRHLSGKTHASFACNHDTTQHMAQRPDRTAPHRDAQTTDVAVAVAVDVRSCLAGGSCYVAVTAQPSDNRKVRPHISEIIITRDGTRDEGRGETESSLTIESLQIL